MNICYHIGIFWLSQYNLSALVVVIQFLSSVVPLTEMAGCIPLPHSLTIYKYPMCQILINLVDILEKIFINIVNSVCEHHKSVIFVIYDPKNIHVDILHDIFLSYAEKTPNISILAAILTLLLPQK